MLRVEDSYYWLRDREKGVIDIDRALALLVCVAIVVGVGYSADRLSTDYDSSIISPPISPVDNVEDEDTYHAMTWEELQIVIYSGAIDWANERLEDLVEP